jgi:hypothetical protein
MYHRVGLNRAGKHFLLTAGAKHLVFLGFSAAFQTIQKPHPLHYTPTYSTTFFSVRKEKNQGKPRHFAFFFQNAAGKEKALPHFPAGRLIFIR